MAFIKRRYLFEADDDDNASSSNAGNDNAGSDTSTDNNASSDTNNDDTSSDDNTDDSSNNDDNSDENTDDNNNDDASDDSDEDYTIDAEPDEDDSGGDEDDSSDDSSDDSNDESSDTDTEDKALDREMFDTLTDEEKKAKVNTLKGLFVDLYQSCDALTDRFNQVDNDDDNEDFGPTIKRILMTLYNLKEYISFYVTNTFDSKSYIENDIIFNRYLSVLNGIKLVAEGLEKIHNKNEESKPQVDEDGSVTKTNKSR